MATSKALIDGGGTGKGTGKNTGVQSYTAPAYGTNPNAARPFEFTISDASGGAPIGGGGGGGVGDIGAPAPMTFDDFVKKNFTYTQTQNEGARRLQDFDAETLLKRQQTEAEQNMRRTALQQTLQQMGGDWANDAANRGILRSGLYLQGQDRVDKQGVTGNQDIDQLLTNLLQERSSGRVQQEASNRSALNDVLSQLSQQFNSGLQVA